MEEAQYQFELANGKSNARGLCVGYLFELSGQTQSDQNREYLVLSADYELEYTEYEAMENQGAKYACGFSVAQQQAGLPAAAAPRASPSSRARRRPSSSARRATRSTPTSTAG